MGKKKLKKENINYNLDYLKSEDKRHNYAELAADQYYLQSWFTKASWIKKAAFIKKIVHTFTNLGSLKCLINVLKPLTKDMYYSKAQETKFSYDCVPNDDNRGLRDEHILNTIINSDIDWFKSLDDIEKFSVLLNLVKIGGQELSNFILDEARLLYQILETQEILEEKFTKNDKLRDIKFISTKLLTKEIIKLPNFTPLINEYDACISLNKTNKSKILDQRLLNNVAKAQKTWETELKKLISMSRTGIPKSKSYLRINKVKEETQRYQILPLWICTKIVKLLDDEARNQSRIADPYLAHIIGQLIEEESVRNKLNQSINKLKSKLLNIKLPGKKYFAKRKKTRKPKSAGKKRAKKRVNKKQQHIQETTLTKDLSTILNNVSDFKQSVYSIVKHLPREYNPFTGLYNDMSINTIYMYDRFISCNRRWIAATENTFIVLYNMITGTKSSFVLSGHSLVVTCVAFFPNSFYLASGSLDGTVKTWDIWNRKTLETFHGHTDVIISLSVNEEYIASCSRDGTIRIFQHRLGDVCIKVIRSAIYTPTMLVLSLDHIVYWATREGALKLFSITDASVEKEIHTAHSKDITFIGKFCSFIVSAGDDCYVKVWNQDFYYSMCIQAFYHPKKVTSAIITHLTLITGNEDGSLNFWHLQNGILFRTIQVNLGIAPPISIHCQEYYNHIKIICNNEANIYVLEFPLKLIKRSKKNNPYQCLTLHPLNKHISPSINRQKRLDRLRQTKCTSKYFRKREDYEECKDITEAAIKKCINESRDVEIFPRYSKIISPKTSSFKELSDETLQNDKS